MNNGVSLIKINNFINFSPPQFQHLIIIYIKTIETVYTFYEPACHFSFIAKVQTWYRFIKNRHNVNIATEMLRHNVG